MLSKQQNSGLKLKMCTLKCLPRTIWPSTISAAKRYKVLVLITRELILLHQGYMNQMFV